MKDNKWVSIMKKEDTFCHIRDNFMGQFARELEMAAGIPEGCTFKEVTFLCRKYLLHYLSYYEF